jgi:hypothetical protein
VKIQAEAQLEFIGSVAMSSGNLDLYGMDTQTCPHLADED